MTPGGPAACLVVDAANVIGSRPDGWWRDRAGAARRFLARIDTSIESGALAGPVVVVLEGRAGGAASEARHPQVRVVAAADGGDDRIVEEAVLEMGRGARVTVVTADRGLAARIAALGAEVMGPTAFLARLDSQADRPGPTLSADR